eukprot:CCRYP_002989-RA/>CCRYP_002989-RA protein AED:0.18 eAED:0.21 QI:0/0/0.5/1/0/0/2/871/92
MNDTNENCDHSWLRPMSSSDALSSSSQSLSAFRQATIWPTIESAREIVGLLSDWRLNPSVSSNLSSARVLTNTSVITLSMPTLLTLSLRRGS